MREGGGITDIPEARLTTEAFDFVVHHRPHLPGTVFEEMTHEQLQVIAASGGELTAERGGKQRSTLGVDGCGWEGHNESRLWRGEEDKGEQDNNE